MPTVTLTPINTHYLFTNIFNVYHSHKVQSILLNQIRPKNQSENFTVNDYTLPVPLLASQWSHTNDGESKVVLFHEDGQTVNFDSYSSLDVDFYSLNVTTELDIHMHLRFAGTGPSLGTNSPIDQYYADPANISVEDCASRNNVDDCNLESFCLWDSVGEACYCSEDTGFINSPVSTSCPGLFKYSKQFPLIDVLGQRTLPYIYFIRGDGELQTASGTISNATLDDKMDFIDPAGWNDWELDPWSQGIGRQWSVPPKEKGYIKTMAGYKTIKLYSHGWYRDPVSKTMKSGMEKHMKDWKLEKDSNQTE
tara:strand:+ start:2579 stop:3502 length:924 start_codon:yes stop_codon:yes gene_type:complete